MYPVCTAVMNVTVTVLSGRSSRRYVKVLDLPSQSKCMEMYWEVPPPTGSLTVSTWRASPVTCPPNDSISVELPSRVMVTVSTARVSPWDTVSRNDSVWGAAGGAKLGFAIVALLRVTGGPAVWVQEYAGVAPEETADAEPSRETSSMRPGTDLSPPASAVRTVISTIWTPLSPSAVTMA